MSYTDVERAKYCPETFTSDELVETFEELEAYQDVFDGTPTDLKTYITKLEENQANEDDKIDAALCESLRFHKSESVQNMWSTLREVEKDQSLYVVIISGEGYDVTHIVPAKSEEEALQIGLSRCSRYDRENMTNRIVKEL